jgi:hypothetical protein
MATTKIISANPYREKGGTALYGGNIQSNGVITNAPGKAIGGSGPVDPVGPRDAVGGIDKILSTGRFADINKGSYVVARGMTSLIANTSNAYFKKMGAKPVDPFRQTESTTTRHTNTYINSGLYNFVNGTFSTTPHTSSTALCPNAASGDRACRSTLTEPGRLTFLYGKKNPARYTYQARTQDY